MLEGVAGIGKSTPGRQASHTAHTGVRVMSSRRAEAERASAGEVIFGGQPIVRHGIGQVLGVR